jgi:phasin family protein
MMDKKTPAAPWGKIPSALDLRKLFDKLELPDTGRRIVASQRKDIEALVEANRQAYRALESLGKRQQEILRTAFEAWQQGTREVIDAPKLRGKMSVSAQRSQRAFSQALTDLRELAELAFEENKKVLGVLNERANERLRELGVRTDQEPTHAEPVPDDAPAAVTPSRRKPAARRARGTTA